MKMKVNASVLMKDLEIDLDHRDIKRITHDHLNAEKSNVILRYAMEAWKKRRGVNTNWVVKDEYKFWQEYENNGSHYSGYYSRDEEVTELDRAIYDCYLNLENALCKFEQLLEKSKERNNEK